MEKYKIPDVLSCNSCKWHNTECVDSSINEGKYGYIVGGDWCEFYQLDDKHENLNN